MAQDEELEKKKSEEQKEKEKKVDDIAKAGEEEKKQKVLDELKNALRKLTSEELDEEIFKLQSELHDIKKQLNPDKEDEESQSKEARRSRYDVLGYDQMYSASHSGDEFLIRRGSRD